MALTLICKGCATVAYADCSCPEGYDRRAAGHLAGCPMGNLGAQVVCPPGAPCCQVDHDHDEAANACNGGHTTCPEPATCQMWAAVLAHPGTPADAPANCPGGHCGVGVPGCSVCRAITIIVPPGHVGALKMASA